MIRPRGMPPTPRARSSAIEPVGIVSSTSFSREPSFMIAPRPNCFSIVARAASTALPRSAVARSAARSSVIAICPSRSSSDPHGPLAGADPMASAGRSAFLRVVLDDVAFLARLADHLDVLRRFRQRRQTGLGGLRLRLLLGSLGGRSREPIASPPRRPAGYRSILHADFSATSPPLTRPARARSSVIEAGNVPARIAARILAMKSRVKVRL